MKPDLEELENRFDYHAPVPDQIVKYARIRGEILDVACTVTDLCPDSRELSTALTKLEEAMFWANAAIARHGK